MRWPWSPSRGAPAPGSSSGPEPGARLALQADGQTWTGRVRAADVAGCWVAWADRPPPVGLAGTAQWGEPAGLVRRDARAGPSGRLEWTSGPRVTQARAAPRAPLVVPVQYGYAAPTEPGATEDLSVAGVRFLSRLRFEPGDRCVVSVRVAGRIITRAGRVVRAGPKGGLCEVAVRFDPDPAGEAALAAALRTAQGGGDWKPQ